MTWHGGLVVRVDEPLRSLGVFVAYLTVPRVEVLEPTPKVVDERLARAEEELRSRYQSPDALREDPVVKAYRHLLWRLKIDPTKVRPSSEALARRVLRGRRIPRINSVVDSGNIASLETMVPIGIYDADNLSPPLVLTLSRGGEEFQPIGGDPQKLRPGIPVLVDSKGRVIHLYPHRDSVDSMVTRETRSVLIIAAGAPGVARARVARAAKETAELLAKYSMAVLRSETPELEPPGDA